MQTGDYWRQFEHTGSVQDYLRYKGSFDTGSSDVCQNTEKNRQNKKHLNREDYAGIHFCNGNGAETDRCR